MQIKTITGWHDRQRAIAFSHLQTKPLERTQALRLRQRHANHFTGSGNTQRHWLCDWHVGQHIIYRTARGSWHAANVDDQLGDALDVLHRVAGVNATLKPVTGVG